MNWSSPGEFAPTAALVETVFTSARHHPVAAAAVPEELSSSLRQLSRSRWETSAPLVVPAGAAARRVEEIGAAARAELEEFAPTSPVLSFRHRRRSKSVPKLGHH